MITYYTDGSASPNPGPGGFAVIKELQPHIIGGEPDGSHTTNIRMEGFAILAALNDANGQPCRIYTDSEFWINVITKWSLAWEKSGWKKKGGDIKNLDIVQKVCPLYRSSKAELIWVRGHNNDEGNELADVWANTARTRKATAPTLVNEPVVAKSAREYADEFLTDSRVMQLATARDNSPWVASVYYVADENRSIYWVSLPDRRHSREIADNTHVAATIAVKHDLPVIGVQVEGAVSAVTEHDEVQRVLSAYVTKHDGAGKDFYERFVAGTNQHQLYKLTPTGMVLFDELHFASDPQQRII